MAADAGPTKLLGRGFRAATGPGEAVAAVANVKLGRKTLKNAKKWQFEN